ncbi:MAG: putative cytochrome [Herbaspirillum sp.]|jgi:cytochrome b561|nr:putative cytochrome [Herbaspirillum sp.]
MNSSVHIQQKNAARYAPVAILLHWLLAILIIAMIGIGWYMMSIERDPNSGWYFNLHKSIGILVAALVALRVIWRLGHKPPALPASVANWQATAAKATHYLLYLAMIAMPAVGILGALLTKKGIVFFGLEVPRLMAPNHDLAETFFGAHSVIAWILVGLIGLHVLAALKHAAIDKDGVFQRMWFAR